MDNFTWGKLTTPPKIVIGTFYAPLLRTTNNRKDQMAIFVNVPTKQNKLKHKAAITDATNAYCY